MNDSSLLGAMTRYVLTLPVIDTSFFCRGPPTPWDLFSLPSRIFAFPDDSFSISFNNFCFVILMILTFISF